MRAPAKINLYLHVTGRRADGYHLLDSIMAFARDASDELETRPDATLRLALEGAMARGLSSDADNLVLRAARLLADSYGVQRGATFRLVKNLPSGAGLGGGSADAAAVLILLNRLWNLHLSVERLAELALALGADVPVCVRGRAARVTGIGEKIEPLVLPELYAVLTHPGTGVDTRAVYHGEQGAGIPPSAEPVEERALRAALEDSRKFIAWLALQHNALTPTALKIAPMIGEVLKELEQLPGCRLARMSGSGSACFALFDHGEKAKKGAEHLAKLRPKWWVAATRVGDADAVD